MCDDKGRCNKVYKNPNYGCQDSIGNRNVGGKLATVLIGLQILDCVTENLFLISQTKHIVLVFKRTTRQDYLTLYLIEMFFNAFAKRADPDKMTDQGLLCLPMKYDQI